MRASFLVFIIVAVLLGGGLILYSRRGDAGSGSSSREAQSSAAGKAMSGDSAQSGVKKAEDVVWMLEGISLEKAKDWARRESLVIIDCRSAKDFTSGHIPGAMSLPEESSAAWIADFIQKYERAAPLLIYCESEECPLAMDLSVLFFRHGYTNVKYLACGYDGWRDGGSPDLTGETK